MERVNAGRVGRPDTDRRIAGAIGTTQAEPRGGKAMTTGEKEIPKVKEMDGKETLGRASANQTIGKVEKKEKERA